MTLCGRICVPLSRRRSRSGLTRSTATFIARSRLWLILPGVDVAAQALPERYPVLSGVSTWQLQYLNSNLVWADAWPTSTRDAPIPLALRLKIVLTSSEEIVRIFALKS